MNYNHFFVLGAQRCGTTYLYTILNEHPEIQMATPVKPEPKFFINNNDPSTYLTNHFHPISKSVKVLGEKGTSYIESPKAVRKIENNFDDAKYIIILRNPTLRAISNYYFTVKHGLETRSLEEVFITNKPVPDISKDVSVSPFDYLKRGEYVTYIEDILEFLPKERIHIIFFEDLISKQDKNLHELYSYLGVSTDFTPPSINEKINAGSSSENMLVINKLNEYYMDYNSRLETLLDIKLNFWR